MLLEWLVRLQQLLGLVGPHERTCHETRTLHPSAVVVGAAHVALDVLVVLVARGVLVVFVVVGCTSCAVRSVLGVGSAVPVGLWCCHGCLVLPVGFC